VIGIKYQECSDGVKANRPFILYYINENHNILQVKKETIFMKILMS